MMSFWGRMSTRSTMSTTIPISSSWTNLIPSRAWSIEKRTHWAIARLNSSTRNSKISTGREKSSKMRKREPNNWKLSARGKQCWKGNNRSCRLKGTDMSNSLFMRIQRETLSFKVNSQKVYRELKDHRSSKTMSRRKRSQCLNTSPFQDSSRGKILQLFCIRSQSRSVLVCTTSSSQAAKRKQPNPRGHGQAPDHNLVQDSAAEPVNHTTWEGHLERIRDHRCFRMTHSLPSRNHSCHLINNSHKCHPSKRLQDRIRGSMVFLRTTRIQRDRGQWLLLTKAIRARKTECAQIQINQKTHSMIHLEDQVHCSQIIPKEAPQEQLDRIRMLLHITNREILTQIDQRTKNQFACSRLSLMASMSKRLKCTREISRRKLSIDSASNSISARAPSKDSSCKFRTKSRQKIPSIDI